MKRLRAASQNKLNRRAQQATLRTLPATCDKIDFWSNDYLGLGATAVHHGTTTPNTVAVGSTGSRLLSGNSSAAERIELEIAALHGFEAGLLFGSGYDANLGLLSCIAGRTDSLILDELAHASLIDGARLSQSRRFRFRHNDVADLATRLERISRKRPDGNIIVVVEATYSMDGNHCHLEQILEVCETYEANLIVDEAHSVGVVGGAGEGLVASLGLQDRVAACVYTFGKAVGYHGAIVAGGDWLRNFLINFCRPFVYSTAPPESSVLTMFDQHKRMFAADVERSALRANIEYFRLLASQQIGNEVGQLLVSQSPIQGLVVGDIDRCKSVEHELASVGIAAKAILSPTVAAGSERIRLCVHSYNTAAQIELLVQTLAVNG